MIELPTEAEPVKVVEGDCREVLRSLPDGCVDAVVTDPPYGIAANRMHLGKGRKRFERCKGWDDSRPNIEFLLDIAPWLCVWGGNYFTDVLPCSNDWLIWHKRNDGRSFSECEMAWTNFGKQTRHLSHHWAGEEKSHPTQKPLAVMRRCIRQLPAECGLILDPFAGSGTTGVAAALEGRRCILIEKEPAYAKICRERVAKVMDAGLFADVA